MKIQITPSKKAKTTRADKSASKSKHDTSEPIGSEKACFYVGDSLSKLPKINKKLTALKSKALKKSYVFREGAKMLLAKMEADLKAAEKGTLHAKKR